jgi:osmotically-inducible protein OsmY
MKLDKLKFALLVCALTTSSLSAATAYAQQGISVAPGDTVTSDRSLTVENDKVRTSAEHHYNSPAERAQDDLLITEVKSALLDKGISNGYPVEVDCDHGTIALSGVVASAGDARRAQTIASNTKGVVGVKNSLTWR